MTVDAGLGLFDRYAHRVEGSHAGRPAVLLQPQPLTQHFLQGLAHRIALRRAEARADGPQPGLECIGGVEDAREREPPPAQGMAPEQYNGERQQGGQRQARDQWHGSELLLAAQSAREGTAAAMVPVDHCAAACGAGLTGPDHLFNIRRLMSAKMPELVDAWRMVASSMRLDGRLPLASLTRLREVLADADGDDVICSIEFGRDALQQPYALLRVQAGLPLICQRTLKRFVLPLDIEQRLGLIRDEAEEAGLLPDYESLLLEGDGSLAPAALVEDELILAIPAIPVAPGSEAVERDWPVSTEEETRVNPFAALAGLKKDRNN